MYRKIDRKFEVGWFGKTLGCL